MSDVTLERGAVRLSPSAAVDRLGLRREGRRDAGGPTGDSGGTGSAPAQSLETASLRAPRERLMGAVTGPGPGPSPCMTEPRESLPQTGTFHHGAAEKVFQKQEKFML